VLLQVNVIRRVTNQESNKMDFPYSAEYAKSGRSNCRGCKSPIGQGLLRLAVMVQVTNIAAVFYVYVIEYNVARFATSKFE
jgi:hypothetical protein